MIESDPEFFWRSYVVLYLENKYELTSPIKCFIEHNNEFKDPILKIRLEFDLNFATASFNEPDNMLDTAKMLLDEGLLTKNEFASKCLIINLLNCRPKQAEKFICKEHLKDITLADEYEYKLLVWKYDNIKPNPDWKSMQSYNPMFINDFYNNEKNLLPTETILKEYISNSHNIIVVDLWLLYYLNQIGVINYLTLFSKVYVVHNTVSIALQEISAVNDEVVRKILDQLMSAKNVVIKSPTIEQQLTFRQSDSKYMEIHAALILAEILNCPAFVGEFRFPIPKRFYNRIIRPNKLADVVNYLSSFRSSENNLKC